MAEFWISFRLDYDSINGRDYDERYQDLKAAILERTTKYWDESSSFYIIRTSRDISEIASACKKAIEPAYDLVLIRELDRQVARVCGAYEDRDLVELVPYVEKV